MSQFYIQICVLLICFILCTVSCSEIEEPETNLNEVYKAKPSKLLKGVQDMFTGPTGHIVVQVAKELINRSAGNSQVKSFIYINDFANFSTWYFHLRF